MQAVDKSLDLLELIVRDGGAAPLRTHAEALGLAVSTAYRLAATLRRRGLLAPARRGHYVAGLRLVELARCADRNVILAAAARPVLRQLARATGATAHLGVFDADMLTYLVKEHVAGVDLFTREGGQLEAYCSAVGKTLLAFMSRAEQDAYLATAPFLPLTGRTVVDPGLIRRSLEQIRVQGFALDDGEISDDLSCVALPLRDPAGSVSAAVSLSRTGPSWRVPPPALRRAASAIEKRLWQ